MPKSSIAVALYRLKQSGQSLIEIANELFSADELLSMYSGREVTEAEGQDFIKH